MKACKECKWIERWIPIFWHLRMCNNPKTFQPDYIKGKEKMFADHARSFGPCGADAKFWEPR